MKREIIPSNVSGKKRFNAKPQLFSNKKIKALPIARTVREKVPAKEQASVIRNLTVAIRNESCKYPDWSYRSKGLDGIIFWSDSPQGHSYWSKLNKKYFW